MWRSRSRYRQHKRPSNAYISIRIFRSKVTSRRARGKYGGYPKRDITKGGWILRDERHIVYAEIWLISIYDAPCSEERSDVLPSAHEIMSHTMIGDASSGAEIWIHNELVEIPYDKAEEGDNAR